MASLNSTEKNVLRGSRAEATSGETWVRDRLLPKGTKGCGIKGYSGRHTGKGMKKWSER